ncbi:hypothetical protein I7I48_00909 [Histoplasma ohiense]|nr:hypothetical protein I7I48_00909 [Histoplasma ohiense (nom. inval.)]
MYSTCSTCMHHVIGNPNFLDGGKPSISRRGHSMVEMVMVFISKQSNSGAEDAIHQVVSGFLSFSCSSGRRGHVASVKTGS